MTNLPRGRSNVAVDFHHPSNAYMRQSHLLRNGCEITMNHTFSFSSIQLMPKETRQIEPSFLSLRLLETYSFFYREQRRINRKKEKTEGTRECNPTIC